MRQLTILCFSLWALALPALSSDATRPCGQQSPCPPVTLEVPGPWAEGDPAANVSTPSYLASGNGYTVDELFASGHANVFNYNQAEATIGVNPGDNLVVRTANTAYKTRYLVAYPTLESRFNGTVIIEALNSTAGYDVAPAWGFSGSYLRQQGIVYIAVTTSGDQSLKYLQGGCGNSCGDRYADLSIDDNGLEYEIISQLASALKSTVPGQSPLPDSFGPVKRVFVTAYSQQAGSVNTLASQFHQPDIDGYFTQAYGFARQISGNADLRQGIVGDSQYCGQPGALVYPGCIGYLAAGQPQVRTNLPVPVYQAMSETDAAYLGGIKNRQADTDTSPYGSYRLVEIPGTSHISGLNGDIIPGYGYRELCKNDPYYHDTPVSATDVTNAYWRAMRLQVDKGILPPYAPRISTDANGIILRDADNNALGGLRLPEFELAKASYFSPINSVKPFCSTDGKPAGCVPLPPALAPLLGLACFLAGSQEPFSAELLAARYPVRGRYVREFSDITLRLAKERFLLKQDARKRLIGVVRGEL